MPGWNMFKKISEKTGFTQTEVKVILFLIVVLIIGFGYKTLHRTNEQSVNRSFSYENEDSAFINSGKGEEASPKDAEIKSSSADEKREVLELDNENTFLKKPGTLPEEKSINLNKASIEELLRLPGIGKKTAERIIGRRNEIGRFTRLEQLLQVKGIGSSKFNKLKKYVFIEGADSKGSVK